MVLAEILAEDRRPDPALWNAPLVSSRLLEYEVWTRIHARHLSSTHGHATRDLLAGISFVEMTPHVLSRALEPFPVPVRALDALHLASLQFLRSRSVRLPLAAFDERMRKAAVALGIDLLP